MAQNKDRTVLRQLDTLFNVGAIRELTDGQLLERFATSRGEVGELAFAALVERHGAMVSRVCRAILRNPEEIRDAFQATFLVLVKKARGLWVHDSLGPWLHQVAFRTAIYARTSAARRRTHEQRAAELAGTIEQRETLAPDSIQILHEEIHRLPERYRVPIVLCDLEGHTCDEVARQMACPVGTVKSWRARGRERLRARLVRRGLAPTAFAVAIAADAARAASESSALETAARAVSDSVIAGEVSASVRTLVNGALKAMILSKLRMTAAMIFPFALLATGFGAATDGDAKQPTAPPANPIPVAAPSSAAFPKLWTEDWPLTLSDAIRIGLDNMNNVRVTGSGTKANPVGGEAIKDGRSSHERSAHLDRVIAPRSAYIDIHEFQAGTSARVRSIEQHYWYLAQRHAQMAAAAKAVEMATVVLKNEESEYKSGRGSASDAAEAGQRLAASQLEFVTKTSDVITNERELRTLLGVPEADGRRIVPVTAPVEVKFEPDWEKSLATMREKHPNILRAKAELQEAENKFTARTINKPPQSNAAEPSRDQADESEARVERQKDILKQVVHQTTHTLARCFLEIDSGYKQYQTAKRLKAAAAQRLEAQRAFYEEGRIPVDRYCDAIAQYTSALANEAQFKATYNVALLAFEEAKGTLLERNGITVAAAAENVPTRVDEGGTPVTTVALNPPPVTPDPRDAENHVLGPAPAKALTPTAEAAPRSAKSEPKTEPSGTTYSFHFTVGSGPKPMEIRGSFTVSPAR